MQIVNLYQRTRKGQIFILVQTCSFQEKSKILVNYTGDLKFVQIFLYFF